MLYWGSRAIMILNILLYGSGIIAKTLACIPYSTLWEPWVQGKCINKKALDVTAAYFNLVVDVFILILPQKIIWKLEMARSKKIGIYIVFSFGVLTLKLMTIGLLYVQPAGYMLIIILSITSTKAIRTIHLHPLFYGLFQK